MSSNSNQVPMSTDVVLRVSGLGKEYRLYTSPRERFKALFSTRTRHRSHWALRNVSFELRRGQCIGVIGDNGAGKSSLLKLLAGTMQPSAGTLERVGRVTAILELGAGFHPEFSGRDNLYFGGSLIGISHEEMTRLEAGIVEFSELGEAMERPVKTYSSGMTVRLAFALVTAVQPDVLIIDEALAVGDQHFQKKCVERIMAFRENGCTILFCSHSFYHIRRLCDAALWLKQGELVMQGPTEDVVSAYEVHSRLREIPESAEKQQLELPAHVPATQVSSQRLGARIVALTIDQTDASEPPLLQGADLRIRVTAQLEGTDEMPQVLVMLEQFQGHGITSDSSRADGAQLTRLPNGDWQAVLTYPGLPLHSGEYVLSAYLFDTAGVVVYDEWYQHARFRYVNPQLTPGLVRLPHYWGEA
ncbi:ABC transporter ATP-binding protein [Acidovorax sp. Root70]|uniref:ABC transporter ATP-binding protein n=1 Tax=Acidovorax sp. Root70 TaxID=1736590 RepID=UPI0006FA61CC|nr:ABC transporter ATP-binding protein [Acidovorax sp. Root70]KRB26975.1 ABC transporter [Acidovorax sp. Root70]